MSGRNGHVDSSQLREFVQRVQTELGAAKMQEFLESCAKELAARLLTKTVRRTPVGNYKHRVGGTLQRGWTAEQQQNVAAYVSSLNVTHGSGVYTIEIVNPVYYAPYVEYGHRTQNGGWVEGVFMLTIPEQEVQNDAPKILERKLQRKLGEIFK